MIDVNFELYKIFYTVVMEKSFTKAAKAMFVTQSSVSQSIKLLEEKLDVKLFFRHKKQIQLTTEGEILFVHVERAYKQLKTAEKKITDKNLSEINIGASDTLCKYFLLPYFKDFHKKYPHIKINIVNQPSRKTLEMIKNGLMDFGIVSISKDRTFEDIQLLKLKEYEEICIVGEELHKKIPNPTTLDQLTHHPMVTLRSNTNTRAFLDIEFEKRDLHLQPEFEMVSVDLIIEMVKADLGIGFAMEDTLKNIKDQEDLFIVNIQPPFPKRLISFALNEQIPLSNASRLFIEHIQNLI